MSRSSLRNNQKGLTIVELIIATSVFSMILLGASAALIQLGKMYYKAIITNRTQQQTRTIIDNLSRPIQFTGIGVNTGVSAKGYGAAPNNVNVRGFCIGDQVYNYASNAQVTDSQPSGVYDGAQHKIRHGLWQYKNPSSDSNACPEPVDLRLEKPTPDGKELLGENMRLKQLDIAPAQNSNDSYVVRVAIIYGDDDLIVFFDPPTDSQPNTCRTGVAGSQFCAISELNTLVARRIKND